MANYLRNSLDETLASYFGRINDETDFNFMNHSRDGDEQLLERKFYGEKLPSLSYVEFLEFEADLQNHNFRKPFIRYLKLLRQSDAASTLNKMIGAIIGGGVPCMFSMQGSKNKLEFQTKNMCQIIIKEVGKKFPLTISKILLTAVIKKLVQYSDSIQRRKLAVYDQALADALEEKKNIDERKKENDGTKENDRPANDGPGENNGTEENNRR